MKREENRVKKPAVNGQFGAMVGVSRRNLCAILEVFAPARAAVNPPLRQATSTLTASVGQQRVGLFKGFFSAYSSARNSTEN
jgi:hypothetical protein